MTQVAWMCGNAAQRLARSARSRPIPAQASACAPFLPTI